jgi:hypothetical protein
MARFCRVRVFGQYGVRVYGHYAVFKAAGKKLDMGKSCVHFESPDDLPLEAIGKLISEIPSDKWIEMYEQSRLKTKAGQAQMTKQDAPSASKVAAKRVDTKRR